MAFLSVSWLVPEHTWRCASARRRRCLRQWSGQFRTERAFLGCGPLHPLCSFERCALDFLAEDSRGLRAPRCGRCFALVRRTTDLRRGQAIEGERLEACTAAYGAVS